MRYPCALPVSWSTYLEYGFAHEFPWSPVRDLNGRRRRALEGDGSGSGHSNERKAAAHRRSTEGDGRQQQRAETISSSEQRGQAVGDSAEQT